MENSNENRRFCSACGAILTGTNFCGECGAKVLITAVHIPEPAETALAAEIPEPVAEPASAVDIIPDPAPVVQVETRPWKFPVAPVILMGIVDLWLAIQLFTNAFVSWIGIVHVCCITAVLVGMIICKKKRNLIVGFAFLAYACIYLIATIINYAGQLEGNADFSSIMVLATSMIMPLSYSAFAISYLVAKPKIAILKNILSGFMAGLGLLGVFAMGIALVISNDSPTTISAFLTYAFLMLPMGLSVILYTPFRRR